MGTDQQQESLFDLIKNYIKTKYNKPGNVYLGVISRIDMFVSGVIAFAKTSKAASRLSEQFRKSEVKKKYYAVLEGIPQSKLIQEAEITMSHIVDSDYVELNSWFRKNDRLRKVECFASEVPGAKAGKLQFKLLSSSGSLALVMINLITGRKHQIRSQFSELGCPVFGDRKYGGTQNFPKQIALHAASVEFSHPTLKTNLAFSAHLPESWQKNRKISELLGRI